ncbi:MAG TPA: HAD family acid phosphatase [Terracidiphilus sp.]|nr:HAD family acid phosphatase [Terracidiphilus sp.]
MCAQHVAPLAPGERLQNLDKFKQRLEQYHACTCACGCYARDLDRQADRTIAYLRNRAMHNPRHQRLALVLDIDETTLSNYDEMQKAGFAYDPKTWDAWVASEQAPAIAGTLRLFHEAQKLGVSVFFLTGRPDTQRAATEQNLRAQGFDGFAKLLMREPTELKTATIAFKSGQRAQIVGEGYTLAVSVGDQWSDLRGTPQAEYSVKYPNPYYFIP